MELICRFQTNAEFFFVSYENFDLILRKCSGPFCGLEITYQQREPCPNFLGREYQMFSKPILILYTFCFWLSKQKSMLFLENSSGKGSSKQRGRNKTTKQFNFTLNFSISTRICYNYLIGYYFSRIFTLGRLYSTELRNSNRLSMFGNKYFNQL